MFPHTQWFLALYAVPRKALFSKSCYLQRRAGYFRGPLLTLSAGSKNTKFTENRQTDLEEARIHARK